jgi:26S proteasome non-ATPase regulatory subunit 9
MSSFAVSISSSSSSSESNDNPRLQLETLSSQRELLEIEADAINAELTSPGVNGEPPAGLTGQLVDAEGFPRGDIDIYNVKLKRKRLNEINTDYRLLMKKIEETINKVYSRSSSETPMENTCQKMKEVPSNKDKEVSLSELQDYQHFAILDQILPGSPAQTAGIQEGDKLVQFGHINYLSSGVMTAVARLVGDSLNSPIAIVVRRSAIGELTNLTLTPKPWGGRGLLGVHLQPVMR